MQKHSMPPLSMPILPIENNVLFPNLALRLNISSTSEDKSLLNELVDKLNQNSNPYLACLPVSHLVKEFKNFESASTFKENELIGKTVCVAKIISSRKSQLFEEGMMFVLQGVSRAIIKGVKKGEYKTVVELEYFKEKDKLQLSEIELKTQQTILEKLNQLLATFKEIKLPNSLINRIDDLVNKSTINTLSDIVVVFLGTSFEEKVEILNLHDLNKRLQKTLDIVTLHIKVLKFANQLPNNPSSVQKFNPKTLKSMLGMKTESDSDLQDLTKRLREANLPQNIQDIVDKEIAKISRMQSTMADYQVIRSYLEWIIDVPWTTSSNEINDLSKAREQLENDHCGLEKVKKRILEYLAVCQLRKDLRAPILCFVGPPGVGKTSIGKSIATALNRAFHRISLGGVKDEAEIRGHRRTYVGALPGLIVQGLKKCKANNPVFLLDEIDKLGSGSYNGDPSSALLEVLDPEQNNTFNDHYINIPIDLSKVLFIATANRLDSMPEALLDRMEIIELSGYSINEKVDIAISHLIPKQTKAHGLEEGRLVFEKNMVEKIIAEYTYEPGVRSLEREIAAICRNKALEQVENKESSKKPISKQEIEEILGVPKFEEDTEISHPVCGVVTGLVYTGTGSGKTMTIECFQYPGSGKVILSGKLGEVLKESAQLALSWTKANAYVLGISDQRNTNITDNVDIHLHFPEGAIPKDGPSAGVGIVASLVSLFTESTVSSKFAMTGEITLQGLILPVGGIKEKVLAAHRSGIKKIIMPIKNKKNVENDIPEQVLKDITFYYISNLYQLLKILFKEMSFLTPPGFSSKL